MEIVVASGNKKKLNELNLILKDSGLNIRSLKENEDIDIEETELTFIGNAKLKALAYAKHLNEVVISDDSGICVEALDLRPGVFSKRYSGKTDHDNNLKLLDELKGIKDRRAYFECVIALAFPDGKIFTYEGRWYGKIALELSGTNGFGYDPLFIPDGMDKVVSDLEVEYKMNHSHRFKAITKLLEGKDEIINYWRHSWKK